MSGLDLIKTIKKIINDFLKIVLCNLSFETTSDLIKKTG